MDVGSLIDVLNTYPKDLKVNVLLRGMENNEVVEISNVLDLFEDKLKQNQVEDISMERLQRMVSIIIDK